MRGRDRELLIDVGSVPSLCHSVGSFHKFHPSVLLALGSYCRKKPFYKGKRENVKEEEMIDLK